MPTILSPKTFEGKYNVKAWGAKGDGSTDDCVPIQNALNAAFTAGGGTVYIPEGNYKITAAGLYIRTNVRLECAPNVTITKGADVVLLTFGEPGVDNGAGFTGHHDMSVTGGIWDMKGATLTTYRVGMATGHNRNIVLDNVTFKDCPGHHGIEVNSSKNVRIQNCRFIGFYHTGDRGFSEAIQIDLAKSSSIGTLAPYDHTSCEDVRVTGCYFGASGTASTVAWPRGVGSHSSTIGVRHRDIIVEGNTFEGLIGVGVGPYSWDQSVITNNIFDACSGGIVAETPNPADTGDTLDTGGSQTSDSQDCTGLVIAGNTFRNTGDGNPSIAVVSYGTKYYKSVTISNNTINSAGVVATINDSMSIIRTQNTVINGNSITGSGDMGISCITGNYFSVSNNTITETATLGIQISGINDGVFSDNVLRNIGQHGIQAINSNDITIKDNYLKGVSRAANVTYYGIRISPTCAGVSIVGNRIRKFGSTPELLKGISISNTATGVAIRNNDIQDTLFEDQGSTSPATSATFYSANVGNASGEGTASLSYTALTTAGPVVTCDTGTSALVFVSANMSNSVAGDWAAMSFAVSGSTTLAANDNNGVFYRSPVNGYGTQMGNISIITGLTPGSNTFTCQYKAITGGTATFQRRNILVIPLGI